MKARVPAAFLFLAACAHGGNLDATSGAYGATLGAGAATAAERSAFGQNPAALRPGSFGLRLGFHRPYGLDDLEVGEAGFYLDGSRAGLACDWRATEITGLYSEHGFRLAASARLLAGAGFPGLLEVGGGLTAWRSDLAGENPVWGTTGEAGLAWRPYPRLKIGGFVAGPPARIGAAPGRVLQCGLEADSRAIGSAAGRETPGQTARLDFRKTGAAPWRILASLTLRPYPGWEASVGAAGRPFQLAAGLSLAWRGFRVRQALRYHRYLGRTWLSGLDYASRGAPP